MAKSKISTNYITIAGWMREDLDLKGVELIIYAIIYGFSQIQNENLSTILSPFQDQLTHFKSEITRMYVDETKDRASLKQEVIQLKELNHKLDKEAKNLVKALKGDKKVQGNWGEFILENILEQSGLRKGHEYTSQKSFKNDENQIYKPDIIIHLPGNRDVVVDSKVSLVAWEKFHSAPDEKNRQLYLKEHCQAVKKHIQTLSSKKYNELRNVHSLDFVLMFLPIETAFLALQEYDQNLINYALDKNILLVSPTSLLTTIRTIENLWRQEKQSKHAQAIASRATILYDKFRQFTEDMEKLGQQLDNSKTTYQSAINRLCKGKGNLVSQAQQLSSLGIKVKKEIPSSIKEESELE